MRFLILLKFCFISFTLFSQTFSESDIKKLAEQVNRQIIGVNLGNGITAKGCLSIGRTLIYQNEVPEYWKATYNQQKNSKSIRINFHFYRSGNWSLFEKQKT
jgi:hypothetical protein